MISARLSFAFRCFFSLLFQGKVPQEILQALSTAEAPLRTAAKTTTARETPGADASKPTRSTGGTDAGIVAA